MQIELTPECPLGFRFDKDTNNCQVVWITAGPSNVNDNLKVLCGNGFQFDRKSKTCILKLDPSHIITGPIVCQTGEQKDQNGKCRLSYNR